MSRLELKKAYQAFTSYKDSYIAWLGMIPSDWEVLKFKGIFSVSNERVKDYKDITQLLSVSGYRGIEEKNMDSRDGQMSSEDVSEYRIVRPGQLVVNTMWLNYVGLGVSKYTGYVSPAYRAYRIALKMQPDFVHYMMRSGIYVQKYSSLLYGIRPNSLQVKPNDFEAIEILVPSLQYQKVAVDYLDRKTAIIDQIIGKKKKQIELLKEQRTAMINQAVISIEGENAKIKNHAILNPTRGAGIKDTDIVSFVPMEALSETGKLELQEKTYLDVKQGFTSFCDNDVVLAKITPCYENGKSGVMRGLKNGFGFGTTEFMVFRPDRQLLSEYLYYVVFSDKFRKQGEIEMRGTAGQKRVSTMFIKNYEFKLPGLQEQKRIVDLLDKRTTLLDHSINKIERGISLLLEFKSSLIANVVTGKIRV